MAVAEFYVFEAVVFVRQGEHGLGEKADGGLAVEREGFQGEFAGAGAHEDTANADVVAEVEEFVEGEGVFADVVFADVDLEAFAALLKVGEAGFALEAMAHEAASDGDLRMFGFEFFGGDGGGAGSWIAFVAGEEVRDVAELEGLAGRGKAVGIEGFGRGKGGVEAEAKGADLFELFEALLEEVLFEIGFELGQRGARLGRGWRRCGGGDTQDGRDTSV